MILTSWHVFGFLSSQFPRATATAKENLDKYTSVLRIWSHFIRILLRYTFLMLSKKIVWHFLTSLKHLVADPDPVFLPDPDPGDRRTRIRNTSIYCNSYYN